MIDMLKSKMKIEKNINNKIIDITVEGEMIIPDTKPDILSFMNQTGIISIYKKEVLKDKVRIDGNVNLYLMYKSVNDEIRGITNVLDFSESIDIPSCEEGMGVEIFSKINSIECKIINERKISIKASINLNIEIKDLEEIEFIESVAEDQNIPRKIKEVTFRDFVGKGSSKLSVKENIKIDDTDEFGEFLGVNLNLINEDLKNSYNKVLVKNDLELKVMYLTQDDLIKSIVYKVPVVGFVDLPDVSDNNVIDTNYEIKNLIIKANNKEEHSIFIEAEIEVVLKMYAIKKINILSDIYSLSDELDVIYDNENICVRKRKINERNTVNSKLNLDLIDNKKLLMVNNDVRILNESVNGNNIKYQCEADLKMFFISMDSKAVEIKNEKIPFEFATSIPEIDEESLIKTNIVIENDTYVLENTNEVNCSLDVRYNIEVLNNENMEYVREIENKGERKNQCYSVVVYIVKKGDTLWDIAKRFGSTVENIVSINEIENPDLINIGDKIFIPKAACKNLKIIEKSYG